MHVFGGMKKLMQLKFVQLLLLNGMKGKMFKKTCCSRFLLHKFVQLKYFWTLFKNVHLQGPCSLRPCFLRPYFIDFQVRLYFNSKIVSVFGTWDIKLCSLLSLSPFLPRVEYYFSLQSLSAMKKPPKKYQTITSPKRQLFFIAILWYFFQKKIFLPKHLMEIGLATHLVVAK